MKLKLNFQIRAWALYLSFEISKFVNINQLISFSWINLTLKYYSVSLLNVGEVSIFVVWA